MPNPDGTPTPEEEYYGMSSAVPLTPPAGPPPPPAYWAGPVPSPGADPSALPAVDLGEIDQPGPEYYGELPATPTPTALGNRFASGGVPPSPPGTGNRFTSGMTPEQKSAMGAQPVDLGDVDAPGYYGAAQASPPQGQVSVPTVKRPPAGPPAPVAAGGPAQPSARSQAEKAIVGSYGEEAGAMRQMSAAEADKVLLASEKRAELAREQQEEAAYQQEAARFQREELQSHLRDAQEQLAAVSEQRIDPEQLMEQGHNRVLAVVGGLVGGLYQGVNKLSNNPFTDAMNKAIDRNIDSQEKNIRNAREGVREQLNLIGHLRTVYKDEELARLQARSLYLEGAKGMVEAEVAKYDSPIIAAKGRMAIAAIGRQQAEVQRMFAKEAEARAAAAAARHMAALKAQWEMLKDADLHKREWYKAETDRLTAEGKMPGGAQQLHEDVKFMAEKLNDPKIQGAQQTLAALLPKVTDEHGKITKPVPGVGRAADIREDVFPARQSVGRSLLPGGAVAPLVGAAGEGSWGKLSPEERQGRGEYQKLFNAYINLTTGVAVGGGKTPEGFDSEIERLKKGFDGAQTPDEQATAVRDAQEYYERTVRNLAAVNPRAYDMYMKNQAQVLGAQKAQPPPLPASAKRVTPE